MSQERVREILSHVDMSKINLSSFKISEKKFNELSHLYRNRVVLSCVCVVVDKENHTEEEVDSAFEMVKKVMDNPDVYSYSHIYSEERRAVDEAINDITTYRNRSINDVKLKAIENRMKDAYKQMRTIIEKALQYGNTFEDEFDDAIVEKCLQIAREAYNNGKHTAESNEIKKEQSEEFEREKEPVIISLTEETSEPDNKDVKIAESKPEKVSFWKRVFGRSKV